MHKSGSKLIIICGLPGSGKTTLAKKLEDRLSAVRFCPDEWMQKLSIPLHDEEQRQNIESVQWEMAQKILASGGVAILEWGTWSQAERDALRTRARALGASVELHYLHATADELYERISLRNRDNPPIKKEAVLEWWEVFQPPTLEEIRLFDEPTAVH